MTNVLVKNLCFYRARFSIQSLFQTTPCPLKHQRENHTDVLASESSHENTVDRRSISFTIKPKSVEPERTFSPTGLFVTKFRNRLNDESVL